MAHEVRIAAAVLSLAAGLAALPSPCRAQSPDTDPPVRYYRPEIDYGSESVLGPLHTLANRGLSNLYYGPSSRDIFELDWGERFSHVGQVLAHPLRSVTDAGGWGEWFKREFLIASPTLWEWSWTSNYAGHVVAGGLTYRYTREWLEHRGSALPTLEAALFIFGVNLVNEAIERPEFPRARANSMADIYIFEPLGFLLMHQDGIARFFVETLDAADWSPQVSLTFPEGRVDNVSQIMSYKVPLPWVERTRALVTVGLMAQVGLIRDVGAEHHVGFTVGFNGQGRHVDPETGLESWETVPAAGLYVDRNNSLLATLLMSSNGYSRIRGNLYPGLLPGPLRPLGLWFAHHSDGSWSLGIGTRRTLGLGLGLELGAPPEG